MRFAPCQTIGPRGMSTIPGPAGCPADLSGPGACVPLRATFDLGNPPSEAPEVLAGVGAEPKPCGAIRFCVAVDFDQVLARKAWPTVGGEMPGSMDFLRWLAGRDWWRVLWTCRTGPALDAALVWLAERGFPASWWTAVNATPRPITDHYGNDSRKPGYHALVDDLAVGFPTLPGDDSAPDWERIKAELEVRFGKWRGRSDAD